jgi:ADP-heptose:LPS heptosyltransferase
MTHAYSPAGSKEKKRILNAKQINLKEFTRILIVAPFNIEDFILCTPAIEALKSAMPPEGKITVLVSAEAEGVAKSCLFIDKTLTIKGSNPIVVISTLIRLISEKHQLVISFNQDVVTAFMVNTVTSAKAKIAYAANEEKNIYNSMHNLLLHSNNNSQHKIIRYLNLARFIGANSYDFNPKLAINEADAAYAKEFLKKNNITGSDILVGIHPASKSGKNRWSISKFQQLTTNLINKYGCKVIVFAHKEEHERLNEYMVVTKKKAILVDTDDCMKMAAISRFLACFVCNESDFMHIFAPFTPVVVIWGKSDPEENKPTGQHNIILTSQDGNADSVPVSAVTDAVQKLIMHDGHQ